MVRTRSHEEKVERIARQLRERRSASPVVFVKKGVSHQVPGGGATAGGDEPLFVGDLDRVLEIDVKGRRCVAEPGVTFSDLVRATLPHGLVPVVVPELKTITIGGAVAGCSVESTSYRRGGFHDTCTEYEVVTSRGDVLRCAPGGEHALVFQMMHGTFGTVGLLTKLAFELMPARPFVEMRYETCRSPGEYLAAILRRCEAGDVDFMDGIVHAPDRLVLCLGAFVDEAPYASRYDWLEVFHRSTATRRADFMAAYDYFFRYDADCHWVMRNYGFEHPLVRLLLGKFMLGSTNVLTNARRLGFLMARRPPDVVVDVFVPVSRFEEFFAFYEKEFDYFPLWIVPYRAMRRYEWISDEFFEKTKDELFIDAAVYGMRQRGGRNYYKLMEEELARIGGIKTLISHNYYDEETFWKTWNRPNWLAAKSVTDPAGVFGDLYRRTHGR